MGDGDGDDDDDKQQQQQAPFLQLCKGLSLDENTLALAKETNHLLLTNISSFGTGSPEEVECLWFAFLLYCANRLANKPEANSTEQAIENGTTLCQILRLAKLNIVVFFKELPHFIVKVGPILSNLFGPDWEKRLEAKELQTNFEHLSLLSRHYKRAYLEFFLPTDANASMQSSGANASGYVTDYHRFGWLLFLALRVHVFSRFNDLVTCTNGLVSIMEILIIHIPVQFRNFDINDYPRFDGLIYFENLLEESSLLSSLNTLEKDNNDAIPNTGELDERLFVNEDDSLLGTRTSSGGSLNLSGAKRKNDSIYSPKKTITSSLSPYRSPSVSNANGNSLGASSKMAATPVSTAMTTAKWLRTVVSPLQPNPSAVLKRFLSSCDRDLNSDVMRRVKVISEAIFPSTAVGERNVVAGLQSANLMDNVWAEQRRLEAVKLYYSVLEAMCTAEAQILHGNNLTSLLTNERFHRCMLACSTEIVLATHKTVTMLFPVVLERTGITAFDLSKVIESFIRHEESLPRELRRHLNSLEERLLESMVWEKSSSLYNSLVVARPSLSTEINRLALLAEPMPSLDAISMLNNISFGSLPTFPSLQKHENSSGQNVDMRSPKRICTEFRSVLVERNSFTSPVKDRLLALNNLKSKLLSPPLQSAFASPTRRIPGGAGETSAESGIYVFFSKITKLAAVRINGMVERLQLSQHVRENVYCLFQQILSQQTALFFNRHIDQIILCCFYGVAKISQLSLTFNEIIYNYRKQPQCKPQVFRSVFVDWSVARRNGKNGQDNVDIVTFYNEVFIPTVKSLLVELGPAGITQKGSRVQEANCSKDGFCPGSSKVSPFPSLPDMSPKKVSATRNVYVSPLRSSKMDALISNSSKSYYAWVGESTHAYQSPSKDLTAINTRLNGNRRMRQSLHFEDGDVGLVSDTLVANSLCLQNGSSASSSGAPLKSEWPVS